MGYPTARLNRLLKNSQPQIPHRLKSVRDDKYKGLMTAYPSTSSGQALKVRPFKCSRGRVFQQPVKPCPDTNQLTWYKPIYEIASGYERTVEPLVLS
jgi:hypothetical protein